MASDGLDKSNTTIFLVPISAVIVIFFLCLWLRGRRLRTHKRTRRLSTVSASSFPTPPAPARAMAERDLEAGGWMTGGGGRVTITSATGHRGPRAAGSNRWAWIHGSRTVEGLNELGEAPPPYDPRARGSMVKDDSEELCRALSVAGSSTGPAGRRSESPRRPEMAAVGTSAAPMVAVLPPGYDEAGSVTRPPAAFVPPSYARATSPTS